MLNIAEPGQDKKNPVIGIDLGTTNSLVAYTEDGQTRFFEVDEKHIMLPSVVHYGADGNILTGRAATKLQYAPSGTTIASAKRLIGKGLDDADVKSYAEKYDYSLVGSSEVAKFQIGDKAVTPVEVSAQLLKTLKIKAEEALEQPVFDAVITVPAYFNDAQRQATKDAARLAGLNVMRLVNEPTAAALAYGLDAEAQGTFMVYDFGGGTFDVSILKLKDGVFQVIATGGDAELGGDDIDHAIADYLGDEPMSARLQAARRLKEQLTAEEEATVTPYTLTRSQLAQIAWPFVNRTLALADEVLETAQLQAPQLDGVVMVGGSTRMPAVREGVQRHFGVTPLTGIDPDKVVACGAAMQAAALSGKSRDDMLLLDVTPLSLGLETMGGLVEKVIPRNTPIPITRAQKFTTFKDGQTAMDIHVLQGERETTDECRSLAQFKLTGIPPMVAGQARIMVIFSVDADGMLTVKAMEETTGTEQSVEVKPSYGLSEDDMITMLKDSITHAKDDVAERMRREAQLELDRAVEACNAALSADGDLLTDNKRAALEQAIQSAQDLRDERDTQDIKDAMEALEDAFTEFAGMRVDAALKKSMVGKNVQDVANG